MKKRIILSSLLAIVMLLNVFCLPVAFAEDAAADVAATNSNLPVMYEPVLVEPGVVELSWEDMSGVSTAFVVVTADDGTSETIYGNRYNVQTGVAYTFIRVNIFVEVWGPNPEDMNMTTYESNRVYYIEQDPSAVTTPPIMNEPELQDDGSLKVTWQDGTCSDERYDLGQNFVVIDKNGEYWKNAFDYEQYPVIIPKEDAVPGTVFTFTPINVFVYLGDTYYVPGVPYYYYVPDPSLTVTSPVIQSSELQDDGSLLITWTDGSCSDSKFALAQTLFAVTKDGEYQGTIDVTNTNTNTYTLKNISANSLYEIKVIHIWVYFGHVVQGISEPILYHTPATLGV